MLADDTPEAWRDALDARAEQLLATAGVVEPPIDMLRVAATLGFVVAIDRRLAVRARHVQLSAAADDGTGAAILLQPEPRVERRHWAVAHEIGEHYAYAVFAELGLDSEVLHAAVRERTANALANRLLLPSSWFFADGRLCDWDLARLKRRYVTASYELIARRSLEAEAPAIVTIFDQGKLTLRRGTATARVPRLTEIERIVWLKSATNGRPREHVDHRCRVRVWPIHEPQWKREIMRTEWPGEAVDAEDAAND